MALTGNVKRDELIEHILKFDKVDHEAAKAALAHFAKELPHMRLISGVKERIKQQQISTGEMNERT